MKAEGESDVLDSDFMMRDADGEEGSTGSPCVSGKLGMEKVRTKRCAWRRTTVDGNQCTGSNKVHAFKSVDMLQVCLLIRRL